jgi:hypothetical protein
MKGKLVMGVVLSTAPAFCGLIPGIPDIVFDPQTMAEVMEDVRAGLQMVEVGKQTKAQITSMAAFVKTPSGWKTLVFRAAGQSGSLLGKSSTGRDLQALAQLTEGRQGALEAIRQIANDPAYQPTAENSAAISNLHLKAVEATVQMNQLKAELDFKDKVAQYKAADPGMADSLDQIDNWHVKQ